LIESYQLSKTPVSLVLLIVSKGTVTDKLHKDAVLPEGLDVLQKSNLK